MDENDKKKYPELDENEEKKRQEQYEDGKRMSKEADAIEAEIYRLYPECRPKKGKTYPIDAFMHVSNYLEILKECLMVEKTRKHYFTADASPRDY